MDRARVVGGLGIAFVGLIAQPMVAQLFGVVSGMLVAVAFVAIGLGVVATSRRAAAA